MSTSDPKSKFSEKCPVYSPFFTALGIICSTGFTAFGAAYGTAKACGGIFSTAVMRPEMTFKLIIPTIMAGLIGIYGLIVSFLIMKSGPDVRSLRDGLNDMAAGISVGLAGLASGFGIGVIANAGSRGIGQQPKLFTGNMIILVFAEVLALYGFIIGIMLSAASTKLPCP